MTLPSSPSLPMTLPSSPSLPSLVPTPAVSSGRARQKAGGRMMAGGGAAGHHGSGWTSQCTCVSALRPTESTPELQAQVGGGGISQCLPSSSPPSSLPFPPLLPPPLPLPRSILIDLDCSRLLSMDLDCSRWISLFPLFSDCASRLDLPHLPPGQSAARRKLVVRHPLLQMQRLLDEHCDRMQLPQVKSSHAT